MNSSRLLQHFLSIIPGEAALPKDHVPGFWGRVNIRSLVYRLVILSQRLCYDVNMSDENSTL